MVRHKHGRLEKQESQVCDEERMVPSKTIQVNRRQEISNRGTAEPRGKLANEVEVGEVEFDAFKTASPAPAKDVEEIQSPR